MTIKIINNWRIKRNWSNFFHFKYGKMFPSKTDKFIIFGIFGIFLSIKFGNMF